MNILVTGGAGYIGSHTCKLLFELGHKPIVLDNLSNGRSEFVKWGPFIEGDIIDSGLVLTIVHKYKIESVIHFAANAYVGESILNPRKYYNNNVISSISFINTIVDAGIKFIVFSSSCSVYGIPQYNPIDEKHPCNPINPYGESKLIIENLLKWYGKVYNFNSISLRYFNAAGADPESVIGECHDPETHLIPLAIQSTLKDQPYLKIFGADYKTKDGTAIRDYIHVKDIAKAHIAAIIELKNGLETSVVNLGRGEGSSVFEVIETIENISGLKINYQIKSRREGDPSVLISSNDYSKTLLNWLPDYKNLESIIKTSWDWHKKRGIS